MFFKPRFIGSGGGAGGSVVLPIIHEDVDQAIQGGAPGEHYHLTALEHAYLTSLIPTDPYWANVVFLLQADGTTGNVAFTDLSASAHSIVVYGNAQMDNTEVKFGTASIKLDGTVDCFQVPAHTDFGFGTGDFTIEWFEKAITNTPDGTILSMLDGSGAQAPHVFYGDVSHSVIYYVGGVQLQDGASLSTSAWTYFAIVREAGVTKLFRNGVAQGSPYVDSNNYGSSRPFTVADNGTSPSGLPSGTNNGAMYIDQIRITKGIARDCTVVPTAHFPVV